MCMYIRVYVYVPSPGILVGAVVIADQVKPEARATVHALHKRGLRVCLLTGDNRRTAEAIAEEVSHPKEYPDKLVVLFQSLG